MTIEEEVNEPVKCKICGLPFKYPDHEQQRYIKLEMRAEDRRAVCYKCLHANDDDD